MPLKSVHTVTSNFNDLSAISEEAGKKKINTFLKKKKDFGSANLLNLHEHSIIFASAIN